MKPNHVNQKVFQFRFNQQLKQDVEDFKSQRDINCYKCYSLAEANWLIQQGFDILRAEDSDLDETNNMKMFLFKESKELTTALTNYEGGPRNGKPKSEEVCNRPDR